MDLMPVQADGRVAGLMAVPDAYVPCLRFSFDGLVSVSQHGMAR